MKRFLSMMLALVLCWSLCACGGGNSDTPETTEAPTEPPIPKLDLGETAATDIAEFTLLDSSFTYYATSLSTNYVAPVDEPDYFTASVGHCLVSVTFKITNKDRGGSLSFAGGAGNWKPNWTVSYNGADYSVKGYSLSSNSGNHWIDLAYAALLSADGNETIKRYGLSSYLLYAGDTVTLRTIGVIDIEPENLTDSFDFTVGVINSKGEHELFTYTVPARP